VAVETVDSDDASRETWAVLQEDEEGYLLDDWILSMDQHLQSQSIAPGLDGKAHLIVPKLKDSIDEHEQRILTRLLLPGVSFSLRFFSFAFIATVNLIVS
jgi:hypothetical protein